MAAWPAIFDADTVAVMRSILTDPARAKKGPDRRYLLSGVLRCGKCGGPVTGAYIKDNGKGETYRCLRHVSRKAAPVDDFITRLVVARLSQPDAVDLFARPDADEHQLAELRAERDGLRERLAGLAEAYATGDIDRAQLAAGTRRLNARMTTVEEELAASATDPTLAAVVERGDVEGEWLTLPQETQRRIIGVLMTLELLPVGSGQRIFDPARSVRITWNATNS